MSLQAPGQTLGILIALNKCSLRQMCKCVDVTKSCNTHRSNIGVAGLIKYGLDALRFQHVNTMVLLSFFGTIHLGF
eukprot:773646-Pelagomonas_calceolata.AAC.1